MGLGEGGRAQDRHAALAELVAEGADLGPHAEGASDRTSSRLCKASSARSASGFPSEQISRTGSASRSAGSSRWYATRLGMASTMPTASRSGSPPCGPSACLAVRGPR
jgi:hypothetical protein